MSVYYTYSLFDPITGMEYIGSRTKGVSSAKEDTHYRGSVKSKQWKEDWKEISIRCVKTVLKEFKSPEEAIAHEVFLHQRHDVARNPLYYNNAKQLSTGFSTAGTSPYNKGVKGVSEATRKKMSISAKARPKVYGRKPTAETRVKLSEAARNRTDNRFKYSDDFMNELFKLRSEGLSYQKIADKVGKQKDSIMRAMQLRGNNYANAKS